MVARVGGWGAEGRVLTLKFSWKGGGVGWGVLATHAAGYADRNWR